ncbi:MAG: glycosyltransferase family 2 protein [Candidatus Acididesulfobacter guangdongensis]|uniref:Glycosyltransferase family 2 protein n=1 Tax=Acididesulfobacter guangdongensis TaxID=2597225 RepID=A0A519BFL9_ACIG2|nr:MAG: glycosyltransferase family 2 protein [Candidatus Acididesulfobacter guangdongensis]
MLNNKKIIVVMPAYNAEKTLEKTYSELPKDGIIDDIIVVDDASTDKTANVAKQLGLKVIVHDKNKGYGGNQKTCYKEALKLNADIIVMLHPDYQYSPKLVTAMAAMIASDDYDMVLASRIVGKSNALTAGMPIYKYISNRFLTYFENFVFNLKMSEYHSGYRAFSSKLLLKVPFETNSDDFIFDNQIIAQSHLFGFRIGEISCPTRYERDSSSIGFSRSVKYGLGVIKTASQFILCKYNIYKCDYLNKNNKKNNML